MENTRELAKQVRSSAADSVKLIKAAKRLSPAKQLEQGSENLNNASKAMTELSRHKRDAQAQEDFRRHSSKYEE